MSKSKRIPIHPKQRRLIDYRFNLMIQKLKELSTEIQQFGLDILEMELIDDGDSEPEEK